MKDEPECEPDDLDEGDDAHAEDQTQKSPNVGEEVDPSHADLESSLALLGYSYSLEGMERGTRELREVRLRYSRPD